jgi:hypothetical protein
VRTATRRDIIVGGCLSIPAIINTTKSPFVSQVNTMAQKDDEGGEERQLTEAEAAIIEFMKQKAVLEASGGAAEDGPKEHKFWDTQVRIHCGTTLHNGI